MDLELKKFLGGEAPCDPFRHADHVRVAFKLLQRVPVERAVTLFSRGVQRIAARAGRSERYHATITWAFLFLVHERLDRGEGWDVFAARNPDLLAWSPSILERFYSRERLDSPAARRAFLLPDRAGATSRGMLLEIRR